MEPEPALFMVEACTRGDDEVTWDLHTITPKGRDVRCRLVVKRAGQMTLSKDGFAANLAQLGYAKAPPEVWLLGPAEATSTFVAT